ncbi:MAG: hypothetical protein FWB78_12165 [Treponema sp.]|nr:hypothetical protein [Treponema sp.]
MEKSIVYLVYNTKFRDEHTNDLLYKIGHTKHTDEEAIIKLRIVAAMNGRTLNPNQITFETFKQWLDLNKENLEEEIKRRLDFLLRVNNEIYEKLINNGGNAN